MHYTAFMILFMFWKSGDLVWFWWGIRKREKKALGPQADLAGRFQRTVLVIFDLFLCQSATQRAIIYTPALF